MNSIPELGVLGPCMLFPQSWVGDIKFRFKMPRVLLVLLESGLWFVVCGLFLVGRLNKPFIDEVH